MFWATEMTEWRSVLVWVCVGILQSCFWIQTHDMAQRGCIVETKPLGSEKYVASHVARQSMGDKQITAQVWILVVTPDG